MCGLLARPFLEADQLGRVAAGSAALLIAERNRAGLQLRQTEIAGACHILNAEILGTGGRQRPYQDQAEKRDRAGNPHLKFSLSPAEKSVSPPAPEIIRVAANAIRRALGIAEQRREQAAQWLWQ